MINWEKWTTTEMMEVRIRQNSIIEDTVINIPKKMVEKYWEDYENWNGNTVEYNKFTQNLRNYIKKKLNHTGYVGFTTIHDSLTISIRDRE